MSRLELAGRVRDVCAGILFRQGKVDAAQALFLQPAPVLLRICERAASPPRFKRRTAEERHAAELLSALRNMAARS